MMHVLRLAATSRCKINTACGIMQGVIGSSWFKLKKWMGEFVLTPFAP